MPYASGPVFGGFVVIIVVVVVVIIVVVIRVEQLALRLPFAVHGGVVLAFLFPLFFVLLEEKIQL
jgi:hypothetical protein